MISNFGFLIFKDFDDLDLIGPWEMIGLWSMNFNGPENVFTISETDELVRSYKGLQIKSDYNFENCPKLDALLIPGGQGTRREVDNDTLIDFIKNKSSECEYVLSVCTGAFLLQKAELLNNKPATTHFASLNRLRQFPEVNVVEERFTHSGKIWTSAGISAGIDMSLAFIADQTSQQIVDDIKKYAEYYQQFPQA